jgi:hypothetical protein
METLQPPDRASAQVIEHYCSFLDAPATRLRFIRRAVSRCQAEGIGGPARFPILERFKLRKIVVEELVPLLPAEAPLPLSVRAAVVAYRVRYGIYGMGVVCAAAVVSLVGYQLSALIGSLPSALADSGDQPAPPAAVVTPSLAADLPGAAPEQVWLIDEGQGYEEWSNGARILTELQTEAAPREYFVFARGVSSIAGEPRSGTPIGIVFHTSQSHIAPLRQEYNSKLRQSSRALLDYVRTNKLYNYVIDRFGRIYRIVPDDQVADHAGNSVWADDRYLYLNLSDSFVGVCFEAATSADQRSAAVDQITEAQAYAGRVLTAMLRSQHAIADANCVTHALVSVNAASHLMGFHTDWARGFPFEALGLTNKYETENPCVAEFGFGHDSQFDAAMGEVWPGIERAELKLQAEAHASGAAPSTLLKRRQQRFREYRAWLAENT